MQYESLNPLSTVVYKKNGTRCDFYEDKMVFKGNTIFYQEIDTINISLDSTRYNYIITDFTATIKFKLITGKSKVLRIYGLNFLGMGNRKSVIKRYLSLIPNICNITAVAVAERYLNLIREGQTIYFGDMEINSERAFYKINKKKEIIVNKDNFSSYRISPQGLGDGSNFPIVIDEQGIPIHTSTFKTENLILLPYLFTKLYGEQ
jgi:hypothetical protein